MENKRIGEILIENNAITEENLQKGLSEQKRLDGKTKIGPILLKMGFVTQSDLIKAYSQQLGLRRVDYGKKIGILDWLVFFAILILVTVVYIPLSVWDEESHYKKIRRERMKHIAAAEEFYYELTGSYTTDINELTSLVEAAMDSLIADSTFIGKQYVNLNDTVYQVTMDESFHTRVDTTFSIPEIIKTVSIDTLYKIGVINEDNSSLIDTLWANSSNIDIYKESPNYVDQYITHYENDMGLSIDVSEYDADIHKNYRAKKMKIAERIIKETNFIRRKFHLSSELIYCPISKNNYDKKTFSLNIDKTNPSAPVFSIISPLNKDDNEMRYGIFRFRPGKSESIIGGEKSWAGE